eukprot:366268-Chlamydomonas_euryale.AAC.14
MSESAHSPVNRRGPTHTLSQRLNGLLICRLIGSLLWRIARLPAFAPKARVLGWHFGRICSARRRREVCSRSISAPTQSATRPPDTAFAPCFHTATLRMRCQ